MGCVVPLAVHVYTIYHNGDQCNAAFVLDDVRQSRKDRLHNLCLVYNFVDLGKETGSVVNGRHLPRYSAIVEEFCPGLLLSSPKWKAVQLLYIYIYIIYTHIYICHVTIATIDIDSRRCGNIMTDVHGTTWANE